MNKNTLCTQVCNFKLYPIVVFSKKSEFLRIEKTGEKWT